MALELVAARLIAKNVGSSLYTWTSVIGIVLAGITLGNYVGGWLADRFNTRRLLAWLFFIASISCLSVLWLDQLLQDWQRPSDMSWPLWIVSIVASMFLLPSTLLGAISPAVASLALTVQLRTGITLGNVYAWGALGSIVGTFLTGFILIDVLGTRAIISLITAVLAIMAVLVAFQQKVFRTAVLFGWLQFAMVVGFLASTTSQHIAATAGLLAPAASKIENDDDAWSRNELLLHAFRTLGNAAHELGLALRLRDDVTSDYYDESNYSTLVVGEERWDSPHEEIVRFLRIDKLIHAYYNPSLPDKLYYDYEQIYAEATERIVRNWQDDGLVKVSNGWPEINSFFIGGGGYVFPRWAERRHAATSVIEVAEIDPAVTKAVRAELGFPQEKQTRIVNIVGDARNVVDDRLRTNERLRAAGEKEVLYDFVFGDAFNDFSVPWHLVTLEFTQKVKRTLKPHGVYMVNLIDLFPRTWHTGPKIALPVELVPEKIDPEWRAAPTPYSMIEVKNDNREMWLGARGRMPLDLREKLIALAPEQNEFVVAVNDLFTRSAKVRTGRFLARFVNTVRKVFDNVYVYSTTTALPHEDRDTFVIVASPKPLETLSAQQAHAYWPGTPFATLEKLSDRFEMNSRMASLLALAEDTVLSDDFAPVDNLLLPVVATQD